MTPFQTVYRMDEALQEVDQWINSCFEAAIDCSFLMIAKEALTNQIEGIKQTLAYKMEYYELYGEPVDIEGIDSLKALIEELGYEQVLWLFGDSVAAVLSEAAAEEESYRV